MLRFYLIIGWVLFGCSDAPESLFRLVSPSATGIRFANTITYSDTLSLLDFEYMYNGGGVGIGDINNDGLQDIYFSGNMVSGRLYLNKGNLHFEDITENAGVATDKWANGVSMVDINQDGYKDIYVCIGGHRNTPEKERANLLFINNGNSTFTESAKGYGLDDTGYAIQSAFFDYDLDGDLDMYLLRNSFVDYHRNTSRPKLVDGEAYSTDRLFRNNGNNTFTDVSREAGILIEGFGLGVEIADINDDGLPDIYVSNDFITNDLLYINNGDGTFDNQIGEYLKHQTYNGMGTDIADYNNDGKVDIVVLDMLPEDNKRWKLTPRGNTYDEFQRGINMGYEHQYLRNTLQLNNGNNTFSEIGQLAGIEATEWSWSALFADYDNDGLKDLFITNGYGKDITNLDFIVYGDKSQSLGLDEASKKERQAMLNGLPGIKVPNYIYRNKGDLTFRDNTIEWGMSHPTYSNGAAYADLDNDGDLDLVISNIDEEASILESRQQQSGAATHYLRIVFEGPMLNREGFGTTVRLKHQRTLQHQYFTPVRGYLSSVEPVVHFGLGSVATVDTIEVLWPDGKYQLMTNVPANQVLKVAYANATGAPPRENRSRPAIFREVTQDFRIDFTHRENTFVDFKVQPILPHMHSLNGPGITVGDINGDGLEDFYVGGAAGSQGGLFIQGSDGTFKRKKTPELDSLSEEIGVLFFDADHDGDLDLYSASGGSEQKKLSPFYRDHLYLNDGRGSFKRSAPDALPERLESKSCVVAGDYDRDGDLDLFVAGRLSPGEYPMPARSIVLRNDSKPGVVRFTDVTENILVDDANPGMVCAALWTDYDNDGWLDLLVAGEFLPLQFYHNVKGKLELKKLKGLDHSSGWWNSLAAGDFDNDGDTDYVAGNLGLNNHHRASEREPLCMYASDYNKDGRIDPVMSYYVQGKKYVGHPRDILVDQINSMRARFRTYTAYANATFEESFLPEELAEAYVVCAEKFETSYIQNLGNGEFTVSPMPLQAQFSPVYGIIPNDYNHDGYLDLLLTGNSYSPEVISGRDDASIGLFLRGDGRGNFIPATVTESGFMADGDSKGMARIIAANRNELILVANNSGPLRAYATNSVPSIFQPAQDDTYALVTLSNGQIRRQEFYYGSGYISHSSRSLQIPSKAKRVMVYNAKGTSREVYPGLTHAHK